MDKSICEIEQLIKKTILESKYMFFRFYPDDLINNPRIHFCFEPNINPEYRYSIENGLNDFHTFGCIHRHCSILSPDMLRQITNDVLFENISLRKQITKTSLKQSVHDVIKSTLAIKIGYNQTIKNLFELGRIEYKPSSPDPIQVKSKQIKVGDRVYVCPNNGEKLVVSPAIITNISNDRVDLFYFTNLQGTHETKRIEINNWRFHPYSKCFIGRSVQEAFLLAPKAIGLSLHFI
jgi:hypothetical protein